MTIAKPRVSVIILNWNNFDQTCYAVESVFRHTHPDVEIILVDNGSSPEVFNRLSDKFNDSRLVILKIGVNRFFGEGNNIGAESATGEILVFLNNDVLVTKNWLEPLIFELDQNPAVGAVGPKFLYPDGRLQEAGAFLNSTGHSVQRGKGSAADSSRFNQRNEVHYVSAACIAIRKKDFVMVGGFNPIYEPAYYEDVELCFSLRAAGLKVMYQPESIVFHIENKTTSSPEASALMNGVGETNRIKFLNRWSGGRSPLPLQERIRDIGVPIAVHSKRLTVVLAFSFDLVFGSREKYLVNVADGFSRAGYRTIIATPYKYSKLRLITLGANFGINLNGVEVMTLSEIDSSVDVCITMGNELYPSIQPIGKVNIHYSEFPFPSNSESFGEVSKLKSVDLVVVNSEFTKTKYIQEARNSGFHDLKVESISLPLSDFAISHNIRNPRQIISIGGFFTGHHTKNQHILIEAFRSLLKDYPDASLVLAGSLAPGSENRAYMNYCLELAKGLPVSFHIDTDSDELQTLVSTSSVYWVGTGFGVDGESRAELCEDFDVALVEAIGAGVIPIVLGSGGSDEIVDFGVSGFKFQTIDGLLRRTGLVFDLDPESQDIMRGKAREKFEEHSLVDFSKVWISIIEGVI